MSYANDQEAFDLATRHLLTQKQRSATPRPGSKDRCLYRAPDGCKCAVGALIPDDIYEPGMDDGDSGIDDVISRFPVIKELFANVSMNLLAELQNIHDDTPPRLWAEELRHLASEYGLNTEVLYTPVTDQALLQELDQ